MARGQLLYRDLFEQRPPGIYFVYLAGFRLLGWTPSAVAWLDIAASAVTTLFLYGVARSLAGAVPGVLAAALYATLTMPAWLYGHGGFLERSVNETFIVVCTGAAAWCAVRFAGNGSLAAAAGVGIAAGAAVVLKPNAGLYFPALLLWMGLYSGRRFPAAWRGLARPLAVAVAASALAPVITVLWLWRLGLLDDATTAVVHFNRYYVAQGLAAGGYVLAFAQAVFLRMKTDPLWFAGTVGSAVALWELARTRRLPPLPGLAMIWGGAAALVIVANGAALFNSYFIQAFPPLTLMAAWLMTAFRGSAARRAIALATAALMLVILAQRGYPAKVSGWARADYDRLRGTGDRNAYLERFGGYGNDRGYSARANAELSDYIRAHTGPDDRIFLFGINGAGVYFHADRLTAQRFLRVNYFVASEFPDPRFRLEAVTEELAAARPRYIIFERLHSRSEMGKTVDGLLSDPAVVRLLVPYRFDTRIEDFTLYRRVDDP